MSTGNVNTVFDANEPKIIGETIIIFNDEDDTAMLASSSRTVISRMDTLCRDLDGFSLVAKGIWGSEYSIPKEVVHIRRPRNIVPINKKIGGLSDKINKAIERM